MNKRISPVDITKNPELFSEIWIYGFVVAGLTSIANLILLIIFGTTQLLYIATGSVLFAGTFLLSRWAYQTNRILLTILLHTVAWAGFFLIHGLFWSGIIIYILIGIWILPGILFFILKDGALRYLVFIPSLISVISLLLIDTYLRLPRLSTTDFSASSFITPIYFLIFGIFIFIFLLRGISFRLLSTKLILSMVLIILIPTVILTMVSYSTSKTESTNTAIDSLDRILSAKSESISSWSSGLSTPLFNLLNENDTYQLISRLLLAYSAGDSNSIIAYRDSLEYILYNISSRYGFKEIYILDPYGFVSTSTNSEYIDSDFSEYEFYISGLNEPITIPPSYFPLEDEISIFISLPILSVTGDFLGIISGRTNIDKMISLVTESVSEPYKTITSFLINSDGTLMFTSTGRSTLLVNTLGAQAVLGTKNPGNLLYDNIEGHPVIGVFRWIPELQVAILVEADQAEIYQSLPSIITGNLSVGLIGFLLAIFASISIVRSITIPINLLVDASRDVISGNFNIQLPPGREDELGTLTDAFSRMTNEIKILVSDLEIRVADRTRDLELRSQELETAAVISRDASLTTNLAELLSRTARLIQERFGFYHVGIFINDDKFEYAVLSAAAGDAGHLLLENKYKIKIGETGMIGSVTKSGDPRIALDVGVDAYYFQNPLLPQTRSEITLPLKIGDHMIGALDVQSEKVSAFDQSDINIMSIIADQLAIAIERTRLLEESNKTTEQLRISLQSQTSSAWRDFLARSGKVKGFSYEGVSIKSISSDGKIYDVESITIEPFVSPEPGGINGCIAKVPIKLRGLTIGNFEFQFSTETIPAETIQFLETVADRLSLALENARLFNEVALRAEREKTVADITTNIRSTTNPQEMVQIALTELKKVMKASDVKIQDHFIDNPPTQNSRKNQHK